MRIHSLPIQVQAHRTPRDRTWPPAETPLSKVQPLQCLTFNSWHFWGPSSFLHNRCVWIWPFECTFRWPSLETGSPSFDRCSGLIVRAFSDQRNASLFWELCFSACSKIVLSPRMPLPTVSSELSSGSANPGSYLGVSSLWWLAIWLHWDSFRYFSSGNFVFQTSEYWHFLHYISWQLNCSFEAEHSYRKRLEISQKSLYLVFRDHLQFWSWENLWENLLWRLKDWWSPEQLHSRSECQCSWVWWSVRSINFLWLCTELNHKSLLPVPGRKLKS